MAEITRPTFTAILFECRICLRIARASKEAIEQSRLAERPLRDNDTDAEIGASFDICLTCLNGPKIEYTGEHAVCRGAGNVEDAHVAGVVRPIEYRGDPSYPWERRTLCDGCIADVRHAGMEIKGEVDPDREIRARAAVVWQRLHPQWRGTIPDPTSTGWANAMRIARTELDAESPYLWIPGALPDVSAEAKALIGAVIDTSFACGEWTSDDDEPYADVSAAADHAQKALAAYIARLESRALSDATGVR